MHSIRKTPSAGTVLLAGLLLASFATSSARAALAVPAYSSLPGAHAKIYLDFGGTTVSNWGSYTPGTIPAYDTDGNAGSFSSTELANIRQIFVRVAEKYSPFNINVTTVNPGNLTNKETARVVIGGNGSWYGQTVGGVAFLNGFTNSSSNIAWAFPNNLGGGSPKTVAEATAHEAGHLFGLSHQSTWQQVDGVWKETQEYSTNGNSSSKRPIMGSSYGSTRGLWWNGTTSSPTTYQDDLARLARDANGFGYRDDDHADTLAGATSLLGDEFGRVSSAGIITTIGDLDLFSFVTGTGTVRFATALAEFGAMLDSSLQLFGIDGSLLQSSATDSLTQTLIRSVTAGQYYVGVSSRGNYGDIGQYSLSGQIVPVPVPEPAMVSLLFLSLYPLVTRRRRRRS